MTMNAAVMTAAEKQLLVWLDRKFKEAGDLTRSCARAKKYGEAERAVGQAEAYGAIIVHLRVAFGRRVDAKRRKGR
jgi:hypothetical protein